MANLKSIPSLVAFDKEATRREKQLESLEHDVQQHLAAVEAYREVSDQLLDLERHYSKLQSEREDLKGEYSDATFENDFTRIEYVHQERERLDTELGDTFEAIEECRAWQRNNPLPVEQMAATVAAASELEVPSVFYLHREIDAIHDSQSRNLQERQQEISKTLFQYITEKDLHSHKMANDSKYRANQERHEQEEKRFQAEREARRRMPSLISGGVPGEAKWIREETERILEEQTA